MASINWSLLQSWSSERAWWYGAFLGDGSAPASGALLQLTGNLSMTSRWRALVAPNVSPPRAIAHAPGSYVTLVCSKALSDWMFQTHGIRGKKSQTLPWPEDLPSELLPHFIRGLWDTDGCIYVQKTKRYKGGNPQRSLVYTSLAVPFVTRLAQAIEGALGLPPPMLNLGVVTENGKPKAQLHYTGAAADRLADWLYASAPEHLRNEDRMEAYAALLALRAKIQTPCACGKTPYADGLCRGCWQAKQPRKTGPGTKCSTEECPNEVWANGLCPTCRYAKEKAERTEPQVRRSTGPCQCGAPAFRKGLCDACYERKRRGVPLREPGSFAGSVYPLPSRARWLGHPMGPTDPEPEDASASTGDGSSEAAAPDSEKVAVEPSPDDFFVGRSTRVADAAQSLGLPEESLRTARPGIFVNNASAGPDARVLPHDVDAFLRGLSVPELSALRPGWRERCDPAKFDHSLYGTIELLGPLASS